MTFIARFGGNMSTATEKWAAMELLDKERWIAINVMGLEEYDENSDAPSDRDYFISPAAYTTCAAEDYKVLKRVRETWIFSKRQAFYRALEGVWSRLGNDRYVEAWPDRAGQYEPGDYSAAAYMALSEFPAATDPAGT
jgi:hypothetical protein